MVFPRATLDAINLRHAQQLSGLNVRPGREPPPGSDLPPNYLQSLFDWIEANSGALQAARDARTLFVSSVESLSHIDHHFAIECSSPSPDSPNWNSFFFALIESDAVYLR